MIEINLLPGARRNAKRGRGTSINLGATLASARERVKEPWLIGAVGVTTVAVAAVALLFTTQARTSDRVETALQKAVQDSTRYSSVLKEHDKAEAKRDTVLRSLNLIRAIDDDRFIWPHVMDEVSRGRQEEEEGAQHGDREGLRACPHHRKHGRHPGPHPFHPSARAVAVHRAGAARQVRARKRQWEGRDTIPARDDVHPA